MALDPNISALLEISESGDGSDRDLQELAQNAADVAINYLHDKAGNEGMSALANIVGDAVREIAGAMPDGEGPEIEPLFEAIEGVHSSDTARSCMTEGINGAYEILQMAFQMMIEHEAEEGNFTFGV